MPIVPLTQSRSPGFMPLRDGAPRRLTRGQSDSRPRFSPDGSLIGFLRDGTNDRPQVHLIPSSGGEALLVTNQPLGVSDFWFGEQTPRDDIRDHYSIPHDNIVMITVESLSADFLAAYGNEDGITPNLDTLIEKSLVFDNLYAAGNRSVRGLEALTLCIPPSAGESLIKRPDNAGLFSTGTVLRENGYTTSFIYGGDSYFDNMRAYFSGNGFEIIEGEDDTTQ